jgi:hypothetical protein
LFSLIGSSTTLLVVENQLSVVMLLMEVSVNSDKTKQKTKINQKKKIKSVENLNFFFNCNLDHAEKPLENALKANVAFISLFDESKESSKVMGSEIENVEVLFTDQGLYIYKVLHSSLLQKLSISTFI